MCRAASDCAQAQRCSPTYSLPFPLQEATGGTVGGARGAAPGRVLVHCSQGVSRSATLAIAYLMWKRAAGYDDVFQEVKAARGVANPNIGFICQVGRLAGGSRRGRYMRCKGWWCCHTLSPAVCLESRVRAMS